MDEQTNTTLSETGDPRTPDFYDPEFDAAIGKAIVEALDANNAIPDNGGARFLMVTITLAEYRQLCRDSEAFSRVQSELWTRTTELKAEITRLQAENREANERMAEIAARLAGATAVVEAAKREGT